MEKILKWRFEGIEDMTGLPEYRNGTLDVPPFDTAIDYDIGGLLIDFGVLTLKPSFKSLANTGGVLCIPPSHGAVVEWRAMTVIELWVISGPSQDYTEILEQRSYRRRHPTSSWCKFL